MIIQEHNTFFDGLQLCVYGGYKIHMYRAMDLIMASIMLYNGIINNGTVVQIVLYVRFSFVAPSDSIKVEWTTVHE